MSMPIISASEPIVLGSASPRRRDILIGLGLPIRVEPANADESAYPGDTPESFLERVVSNKMRAVLASSSWPRNPHSVVLVADTVVLIDGEILGKPTDAHDAFRLLWKLAGRTHCVQTRYALELPDGRRMARTVCSGVVLRSATAAELQRYAATEEGFDKAGAYAAQGLGSFLVERIEGSYTNVVGLPACELIQDLSALGALPHFPL